MKNTILDFEEKIEGTYNNTTYIAKDYTSKYFKQIKLLNILNDLTYIDYYELTDNQTIEQVSYILYDTPDYWDILVLINNIDPLFGMTYEFDVISDATDEQLDKYYKSFSEEILQETKDRLKNIFLKKNLEINENNRRIKVIRPDMITEFIKILINIDFTDIDSVKKLGYSNS